ncbi:zinc metalloproteinase nas-14-like [Ylistrum balloti]|uniref:zinc metalloproteinase nas-14-like n=1 Tax=Ylistrum balloti TaxID=509963 RepID=UPI0029057FF8|nr:zinc metalloproteinase nas-14-like [Ylistrum balloti]
MVGGHTLQQRSGFTRNPNPFIKTLITMLGRQARTGGTNRRQTGPLRASFRGSNEVESVFLPKPIDEVIEEAVSRSAVARIADQRQLKSQSSVVIEGDILLDQSELNDLNKQIRLDLLEEIILKKLPRERENDIAFRDLLRSRLERRAYPVRRKRAARRSRRKRWPDGVVGIRIASSGFTRSQKNRIADSMDEISEKTCICFNIISRTQALDRVPHVRIVDGNGCRSRVGRSLRNQGGTRSQDLTLASRCRVTRVATHELLHALGLHHEQSRPDRNKFVDVIRRNVERGKRGNFKRYSRTIIDSRNIPYDYYSIMHYGNKAFSRNGDFTVIPRPEENRRIFLNRIGRSNRMSSRDAQVINRMYNCPTVASQPTCSEYPYRFP